MFVNLLGMRFGMKIFIGSILFVIASFADAALLPKTGACPAGYVTSGSYCKPSKNARFAVEKHGGCPSGYSPSGGFCLASRSARTAAVKEGSCPAGWVAVTRLALDFAGSAHRNDSYTDG